MLASTKAEPKYPLAIWISNQDAVPPTLVNIVNLTEWERSGSEEKVQVLPSDNLRDYRFPVNLR